METGVIVLFSFLVMLIVLPIIRALVSSHRESLFSPECFLSIYVIYYIVLPFLKTDDYSTVFDLGIDYLMIGATLFVVSFQIAFSVRIKKSFFARTNILFSQQNSGDLGIKIFVVAVLSYIAVRGFTFSLINDQADITEGADVLGHTDSYILNLISFFPVCTCLFYVAKKKYWLALSFLLSISIYIIGGFRFRILLLFVAFFTFIHLYPRIKKINWKLWIPVVCILYISMGIMENSRQYGSGLDLEKLTQMKSEGFTKQEAKENELLYSYSAKVMKIYSDKDLILFEPLLTAVAMPIPRALFPGKPDGQYQRDANIAVYGGTDRGFAFFNFTEAFISFGWIGVVLYGVFFGRLSKLFWSNYRNNKSSIGAILLLGTYNGILFIFFSRGYLAQNLTYYMYYVPICFWIARFLNKIKIKSFRNEC